MTTTAATALVDQAPRVRLRAVFDRFWPYTRPFRGRLALSLLLAGIGPALSTASIWLFKILVDDVLTPHDFRLFPEVAAGYLAITLLEGLATFADEYLSAWVGERFVLDLRTRLFAHLHRLSPGYFENRQLGDIMSRLTGDVGAVEQLVLTGVNQGLTYLAQIALFTGALFYLNWQLALASLIAAPGFLLVARVLSRRIRDASREQRRRSGSISAVAEESLGNVALVQAYDRQADEVARFHEENLGGFAAQMLAVRLEALFGPLSSLLETIGVLMVMGLAVWELTQARITLGGLLVFIAYLTQLYGPITGTGSLWNSVFAAGAGAERIIELLAEEPGVREPDAPRPLRRATGMLAVEQLSFRYPGTDRAALSGIGFRAAPGQKVAIVGASGAGKTTLTKLLLRFADPDTGRITLDGHDLRELSLSDLRRNITAVLQETLVFDGTVADNIRWGKPDATGEEITRAAVAADAHDFITRLADGYDTRIGQRGRLLSGGQRQRLAIARAVIRDSPVLLLDEPTTGLDAESTQRVIAPLRRLMAGRTTIIISHNLLTIADADLILFLDGGRIEGAGTHDELLRTVSGYARLYRLHHPSAGPQAPVHHPRAVPPGRDGRPWPPRPQPRAPRVPAAPGGPGPRHVGPPTPGPRPVPHPGLLPVPPMMGLRGDRHGQRRAPQNPAGGPPDQLRYRDPTPRSG